MCETLTGVDIKDLIPRAVDGEICFVPPDDKLVGAVCVVYVLDTGEVLLSREKMNKLWCDKNPGDFSPPAGGRELGETIGVTLRRELWQETGLQIGDLVTDPKPIGYFRFHDGSWIVAHVVVTTSDKFRQYSVGPQDGETDCPLLWSGDTAHLPLRGGMGGILKTLFVGKRMAVGPASVGRHIESDDVFDPTILIVDASGGRKEVTWNTLSIDPRR
ncbi:hypothetical protein A2875_04900 [Candidatus Gottesmanbacteria bacterium RIFCSPHIGHO2_01_FULL_46_14]|uniref:Nudix hydrolase domain-containing protein n=3 Tax=Candidatus Gottesmaniibacteriota TaxID=1752720 RepID=A0A1F5ZNX0_9BACT|nr:MAG: hypothetical protein UY08_C0010G0004 [Candidatus Gottesmanbacteria bacterium GW2011_GWA1_47_8]OGG14200.1 MAG: hypothetical protein A2875_04900 [Candidatus Gottesmanbacteria bacterium RIFCSPHIGHO2_01_FULL_46_14]OGG29445.1 MAG: hypothetical protein A2971_02650 [Candidatus Gottesmanbacteria bacterium RIFCSPLOWO2_01_FULL_46_21]